jgi:aspartate racemase
MWSFDFGEIEVSAACRRMGQGDGADDRRGAPARERRRRILPDLFEHQASHGRCDSGGGEDSAPAYRRSDGRAHCRAFDAARRLLGTAFTMEQDFYKGRLADRFGLDVLIPDAADRARAHRTIYGVAPLIARRAQGIVLGCTEIMLLVRGEDSAVPLFDTTSLHVEAAVKRALSAQSLPDCAG